MKILAPIALVELEEYLFSQTAAKFAQDNTAEETVQHIRGSFRMHRFFVFTWLLQNGVELPTHLIADSAHPPVGQQQPDQPVPPS